MAKALKIRKATAMDVSCLLDLYKHLSPDNKGLIKTDAVRIFEKFLLYKGSAVFVGVRETELITSCALVVVPNLTRGGTPYGLIENVVTHRDFRNQGHGKAVLQKAINAAWMADCYKVMLLSGSQQNSTLQFYRDVGFEQSKTGFQIRRDSVLGDQT